MRINRTIDQVRRSVIAIFPVVVLILLAARAVQCQVGDPAKAQMQQMTQREIQLNNLGKDAPPDDRKRSQALMDQISQDFERLLTLHNEIARAITAKGTLGSQYISDASGEIRKRSVRLQSSLQLPKPDPDTRALRRPDVERLDMNDALILLCQSIENFVRNPIIDKPGTVNAEELQKARAELQTIVEISEAIKKRVEKEKP